MYKKTMKTKFMMMMAAAAMVLAACSNDENEIVNNGPVELQLSSGVEVQQTRANTQSTAILNGEKVYAWADEVITSPTSSTSEHIKAWNLTAGNNNALTGTSQYFPQSGNSVNIYALHGNSGSTTFTEGTTEFPTSFAHNVENNQAPGTDNSMANYAKSDLLYARAMGVDRSGASGNVKKQVLTFYHMLSKVEVALVSGKGSPNLEDATVTIENTKLKATFTPDKSKDIADKTSGQSYRANMIAVTDADNNVAPITIGNSTSADFNSGTAINYNEAIIVPQTISGTDVQFIKVQLRNNAALSYKVSDLILESGKKYTYNITVNLTGLEVTSTIEDWEAVTPVNGSAEM